MGAFALRSSKLQWLAAAAALCVAGQAAASTVLVDQPYDPINAGGFSSVATNQFRWADPISLAADSTVSQVTWYGSSYGKNDAALNGLTFDVDFYADDAGNPGNPGATVAHRTGAPTLTDQGVLDRWSSEVYLFTLDITPVSLAANTDYFFSVASPAGSDFIWEKSTNACCTSLSGSGGQTWTQQPEEKNAFSLIGDVNAVTPVEPGGIPEPATWALMLSGFFGAGAVIRRRRAPLLA